VVHDPTGACYTCLLRAGCIDVMTGGASGNECEDLMGNAVTGPSAGAWKPSLCRQAIDCILRTSCANPSVLNCYCGASDAGTCGGPGAATGACLSAENAGLETTDAQTALGTNFTSKTLAAGIANSIFLCAAANHCDTCLGVAASADAGAGVVEAGTNADQ
jgi:hypothetical protein